MEILAGYQDRIKKYLPGGVQYNYILPWKDITIYYQKAEKSRVWDLDGNEYLDLNAKHGAVILGHGNEECKRKMKETMDNIASASYTGLELGVLETINRLIPSAESIRFDVSEMQALEDAISIAKIYTGREKVIVFGTGAFLPSEFGLKQTSLSQDEIISVEWNKGKELEREIDEHKEEIAAVILEPIFVSGGGIEPRKMFLSNIRTLCDRYGIILIFNEIVTGFRVGLGGAQKKYNVKPDLTVLGRTITGGLVPLSVIAGNKEVMQVIDKQKFSQKGYFSGFPLCMTAAKATMDILCRDGGGAYRTMLDVTEQIHSILKRNAHNADLEFEIQGSPLCSSFHCRNDEIVYSSDYKIDTRVKDIILNLSLQKNGILVDAVSKMYPNLAINRQDLEWLDKKSQKAFYEAKQIMDYCFG